MSSISAGAITAQAYRFAFGNFLRILGIIWLPLALEFAGLYLLAIPYLQAIMGMLGHMPQPGDAGGVPPEFSAAMQSLSRYAMLFVVFGLFLRAVVMLGVTQEAFGIRKGPPFVYFAIGRDVWRLFGAYFIFYILFQIAIIAIVFAIAIPSVIVGVIAAVLLGGSLPHTATAGALVGLGIFAIAVLFYGAIFYFLIRMGFLLTPVVVLEKKIDIARIWNLTKGHVWRIFLVCVAITLPAMIVYMLVSAVLFFHAAWPALASMPRGPNVPGEIVRAHMTLLLTALWAERYIFVPLALIFATVFYGLIGGATVFTYRALVPPPKPVEASAPAG